MAGIGFYSMTQDVTPTSPMEMPAGNNFLVRVSPQGGLTVDFIRAGRSLGRAEGVGQGFGVEFSEQFDLVRITTQVAQTITADVADGKIQASAAESKTDATIVQATQVNDPTQLDIGIAAVSCGAPIQTAKKLMFQNAGTTTIYLGGAGVTADSPIQLAPGDYFEEVEAAAAQWYALSSAAGGLLNVMAAQ